MLTALPTLPYFPNQLPRLAQSTPEEPNLPESIDIIVINQQANHYLNAEQYHQTLDILEPWCQKAKLAKSVEFFARYAQALLGIVDKLNDANQLGAFLVVPSSTGNHPFPQLNSERINCYLGVVAGYSRFLAILKNVPEKKEQFVAQFGNHETAARAIDGVQQGLLHAKLEIRFTIHRLSQVNMNRADTALFDQALAVGILQEDCSMARSFREVQHMPFYTEMVNACAEVNHTLNDLSLVLFWYHFSLAEKKRYQNIIDDIEKTAVHETSN